MPEGILHIDESLQKIAYLFRYLGISLEIKNRTTKQKIKVRAIYIFNSFWLGFDLSGAIYWLIDGIVSGGSFIGVTFMAPCIPLCFVAITKSMFLIFNENHVDALINNLRSLEVMAQTNKRVTEKETVVAEERTLLHYVIKALSVMNAVLVLSFFISPLIQMLIKYLTKNEVELMLPLPITYPFDCFDIRIWPFVYMHQFWSECLTVIGVCTADYLLYIGCSYITIQFKLLQYDFENVVPDLGDNTVTQSGDRVFIKKYEKLIMRHQMCLRAADLLESIYSKSILMNFISSSGLICLSGFNVTAIEEVMDTVLFVIFLLMCLMQIYFLCFFGDMLMQSSTAASNAVYSSRWYYADSSIGKTLLLVLTRAQKPCKLTAMGFADVNLMSFTRVRTTISVIFIFVHKVFIGNSRATELEATSPDEIKQDVLSSSWSYFCLLQTMNTPT